MIFLKKAGRAWWLPIIPLAALLFYLNAARIVNAIDDRSYDYFTFWLAGKMLTQGGNPYSPDQWVAGHAQFAITWIPNQVYVYPLPLAFFFAPLGLIPLHQSYILWVTLSQGMILASLFLLCAPPRERNVRLLFLPLLAGLILFRPTTLALVTGQLSACLLFLLACICVLWTKGKWVWGGLILSALMLKPNLGAPLLLMLVAWLFARKKHRALLALFLGGLFLFGLGMLKDPAWPLEYIGIGSSKLTHDFGFSPTVWGLASLACRFQQPCTLAAGGAGAALLALTAIWLLVRRRGDMTPLTALSLAIPVTLLVTPYTWTYDQLLLLLPVAAITFSLGSRKRGFLPAALLFLGLDLLAVFLLVFNTALDMEILNAVIPLVVLGLVIVLLPRKDWQRDTEMNPIQAVR
jgi:hypothetical protein